jgi:hypothetical protein
MPACFALGIGQSELRLGARIREDLHTNPVEENTVFADRLSPATNDFAGARKAAMGHP